MSNILNASSEISNWPFLLISCSLPLATQGLQEKASPLTSRAPSPPVIVMPLFSPKPSSMQTSTDVDGGGVLPRTSRSAKLVGSGSCGGFSLFCRTQDVCSDRPNRVELGDARNLVERGVLAVADDVVIRRTAECRARSSLHCLRMLCILNYEAALVEVVVMRMTKFVRAEAFGGAGYRLQP